MTVLAEPDQFARELRRWRTRRRLSQLELSIRADTTQRHLSFLEQGRSRPGRAMVVRLAESLGLSLRERNDLLLAAGYAPVYTESSLDAPELGPVREALERILDGHLPYPAVVVRRYGELVAANPASAELDGYLPDAEPQAGHLGFAVPLRLRTAEGELHLITTLTSFATAVDVTLSELHLEAFLPADETTATILRQREHPHPHP
ncbi:helix-turn-helix domain-containing protein [Spirillospora sp. CA-255316]